MRNRSDFNWKSSGPGGCDAHCIEHPCGKCARDRGVKFAPVEKVEMTYESARDKAAAEYAPHWRVDTESRWSYDSFIEGADWGYERGKAFGANEAMTGAILGTQDLAEKLKHQTLCTEVLDKELTEARAEIEELKFRLIDRSEKYKIAVDAGIMGWREQLTEARTEIERYAWENSQQVEIENSLRTEIDRMVGEWIKAKDEANAARKLISQLAGTLEAVRSQMCWELDRDQSTMGMADLHTDVTQTLAAYEQWRTDNERE